MVHVVKGRQHSAYTVYRPHRCRRLNRRWCLKPTLDPDSDKFRYFSHDSALAVQLRSIVTGHVTSKVWPTVLIRENSTQLIMYSLDTCIRYSIYSLIFESQKDSIEAPNFFILTSLFTS